MVDTTQIEVDTATAERLIALAGDVPVSAYLAALSDTAENQLALDRGAQAFDRVTSTPGIREAFVHDFGLQGSATTRAT
ncbi:antitoxin MazE7 [Streptomyces xanthochromogenes]|uniref:antitoxin MazE7 n=1 Tax=Streptomyces xanthochromogenes TaxID=67384 RepID=UPI00167B472A|nr:antitoxin MazE7 [Streptomyces xanthochromogenes]